MICESLVKPLLNLLHASLRHCVILFASPPWEASGRNTN